MPDDAYNFSQTRTRLEEIVSQVRKKDVSLEKSLDLLEEGVRLANQCTELIDHADWGSEGVGTQGAVASAEGPEVALETGSDDAPEGEGEPADEPAEAEDEEETVG